MTRKDTHLFRFLDLLWDLGGKAEDDQMREEWAASLWLARHYDLASRRAYRCGYAQVYRGQETDPECHTRKHFWMRWELTDRGAIWLEERYR